MGLLEPSVPTCIDGESTAPDDVGHRLSEIDWSARLEEQMEQLRLRRSERRALRAEFAALRKAGLERRHRAKQDSMFPPPTSIRNVKEHMKWGTERAMTAFNKWRDLRNPLGGEDT